MLINLQGLQRPGYENYRAARFYPFRQVRESEHVLETRRTQY